MVVDVLRPFMGRAGTPVRVLHVDDEEQYAQLVADRLEAAGDLSVATETTAADAIERLEAEPFDCLLTDYRMPDVDGIELARRVRQNHPDLPVVLLTGKGSEAVASEAISAGVTDYFSKDPGDQQFDLLANRIETAAERYRAEQQLREERRRNDEFVRLVAHDLRNPMAVARGWVDILHDEGKDAAYEKARTALDRMDDIVDNLEALARSDEVEDIDQTVELSAVATAAWEMVDAEHADLRVEYGPEVVADASMLQQVLENMFVNAVEHGGEDVTVRVGTCEGGFYVNDDGRGIDPADREKIFESGFTADGGTGLGLAIVQRIADAHDWSIDLDESESGGACFHFSDVDIHYPETRVS
jgi:two-component system OmpR family sensor kinase